MFKAIQKFIEDLQESSEARKLRWLAGSSLILGGLVVLAWSGYFSGLLVVPQPAPILNGEVIAQPETTQTQTSVSLLEVVGNRLGLVFDAVGSIFFGPATVSGPEQ